MPVHIASGVTGTNKSIVAWDNIATRGTVTSSPVAPGFPAINAADPATWNSWKFAGSPAWWQVAMPAAVAIDTVGVAGHTFASGGCVINIQRSDNASTWVNVYTFTPATNEDFIVMFPSASARYWRIVATGAQSSASCISFSQRLTFPHTPIDSYTPLHHARRYTKEFNDSIKGAGLGTRVLAAGAETDIDFGFVPRTYVDGPLRAFENHYNRGGYFFYAGYPGGSPQDMGYCRADSEDAIINVEYIEGAGLASLSFGVKAYVG